MTLRMPSLDTKYCRLGPNFAEITEKSANLGRVKPRNNLAERGGLHADTRALTPVR